MRHSVDSWRCHAVAGSCTYVSMCGGIIPISGSCTGGLLADQPPEAITGTYIELGAQLAAFADDGAEAGSVSRAHAKCQLKVLDRGEAYVMDSAARHAGSERVLAFPIHMRPVPRHDQSQVRDPRWRSHDG